MSGDEEAVPGGTASNGDKPPEEAEHNGGHQPHKSRVMKSIGDEIGEECIEGSAGRSLRTRTACDDEHRE